MGHWSGHTCFVILLVFLGGINLALADGPHGSVDQSFTGPFGSQGSSILFNSDRSVSQEFTPQSTTLAAIDVLVYSTDVQCNDDWIVNIREGPGLGDILGTKIISNPGVSFLASRSTPHVEHIHFDSSISLTPGMVHTIEIQSSHSPDLVNCQWVVGDTSNPYPGGSAILGTTTLSTLDLGFATYSEGSSDPQNPLPTSDNDPVVGGKTIPIDTTALLLASTQITASWLIPIVVTSVGISLVILRKL